MRNRPHDGQVGYYVVLPLVTEQGPALLVNRGWVPAGESATDVPDVPAPPAGDVTVVGAGPPQRAGRHPRRHPASAARSPGSTSRRSRRTSPTTSTAGTPTWCASSPRPGRRPIALDPPEPSEGPHLAYAFQWFLFACLALGGYVVLARREAADRQGRGIRGDRTVPVRIAG